MADVKSMGNHPLRVAPDDTAAAFKRLDGAKTLRSSPWNQGGVKVKTPTFNKTAFLIKLAANEQQQPDWWPRLMQWLMGLFGQSGAGAGSSAVPETPSNPTSNPTAEQRWQQSLPPQKQPAEQGWWDQLMGNERPAPARAATEGQVSPVIKSMENDLIAQGADPRTARNTARILISNDLMDQDAGVATAKGVKQAPAEVARLQQANEDALTAGGGDIANRRSAVAQSMGGDNRRGVLGAAGSAMDSPGAVAGYFNPLTGVPMMARDIYQSGEMIRKGVGEAYDTGDWRPAATGLGAGAAGLIPTGLSAAAIARGGGWAAGSRIAAPLAAAMSLGGHALKLRDAWNKLPENMSTGQKFMHSGLAANENNIGDFEAGNTAGTLLDPTKALSAVAGADTQANAAWHKTRRSAMSRNAFTERGLDPRFNKGLTEQSAAELKQDPKVQAALKYNEELGKGPSFASSVGSAIGTFNPLSAAGWWKRKLFG